MSRVIRFDTESSKTLFGAEASCMVHSLYSKACFPQTSVSIFQRNNVNNEGK
jgi:hypothetical protein